jgi:hypothetical protein
VLQKIGQMGGRKPSKLMAYMIKFCLARLEQSLPFHYLFTQRLPQDLRTQLGEVEPGNPRELAAKAEKLSTPPPPPSAVASMSATETAEVSGGAFAAVRGGGKGYHGKCGRQRAEEEPRPLPLRSRAVLLPPQSQLPPQRRMTPPPQLSTSSPVVSASSTENLPTG